MLSLKNSVPCPNIPQVSVPKISLEFTIHPQNEKVHSHHEKHFSHKIQPTNFASLSNPPKKMLFIEVDSQPTNDKKCAKKQICRPS